MNLKIGAIYGGIGSTLIGPVKEGFTPAFIIDPRKGYLVKETIEHNWPGLDFSPDREDFKNEKVDLLVGQPKCSEYSLLNRNRTRDDLYRINPYEVEYVKFLQDVKQRRPEFFILENLPRIRDFLFFPENSSTFYAATEINGNKIRSIEPVVDLSDYKIRQYDINAVNFGVPQLRRRLFIIGYLEKYSFNFTPPIIDSKDYMTVEEALEGVKKGMANHDEGVLTEKQAQKIVRVNPGEKSPNKERRLRWDHPSPTIVSSSIRHIHPRWHRYLSARECARLMGYPDKFIFFGSTNQQLDQIGRAICPEINRLFSSFIIKSIINHNQKSRIESLMGVM